MTQNPAQFVEFQLELPWNFPPARAVRIRAPHFAGALSRTRGHVVVDDGSQFPVLCAGNDAPRSRSAGLLPLCAGD